MVNDTERWSHGELKMIKKNQKLVGGNPKLKI